MTLSDAPCFITNMSAILSSVLDKLHELDRENLPDESLDLLDASISMLVIANDACGWTVRDIENGPDYKLEGRQA